MFFIAKKLSFFSMNTRFWCTSRQIGRQITMGKQHFLRKFYPNMAPLFPRGNNNMSGLPLCARATDELWYSEVSFHTRPGHQVLGSVGHGTRSLVRWVQPRSQGPHSTSRGPWKRGFRNLMKARQLNFRFIEHFRLLCDLFTRLLSSSACY